METTKHRILNKLCAIAEAIELSRDSSYMSLAREVREAVDEIRDTMFSIDQLTVNIQQPEPAKPTLPKEIDAIPISELYKAVEDFDNQRTKMRAANSWRVQKSGLSVRVMHACCNNNIKTIGDLARLGRVKFRANDGIGQVIMDCIDDLMRNKYGIQSW